MTLVLFFSFVYFFLFFSICSFSSMTRKVTAGCFRKRLLLLPYTYKLCNFPHICHPQLPTLPDTHRGVATYATHAKKTHFNINTKTRYIIPIAITFGFCNSRVQYPLRVRYCVAFSLNGLWGKMYRLSFCVSLSSGHS